MRYVYIVIITVCIVSIGVCIYCHIIDTCHPLYSYLYPISYILITIDGIEITNVGISTTSELCLFLCPSVSVTGISGAMPCLMCLLSISAREYGYAIIGDLIIILFSCTRVTVYDIFIIYVADPIYTIWSSFGLSSTSIMHDPYIILTIVFIFNIIAVFTSKLSVMIAILYHSTCVSGTLSLLSYSSH